MRTGNYLVLAIFFFAFTTYHYWKFFEMDGHKTKNGGPLMFAQISSLFGGLFLHVFFYKRLRNATTTTETKTENMLEKYWKQTNKKLSAFFETLSGRNSKSSERTSTLMKDLKNNQFSTIYENSTELDERESKYD